MRVWAEVVPVQTRDSGCTHMFPMKLWACEVCASGFWLCFWLRRMAAAEQHGGGSRADGWCGCLENAAVCCVSTAQSALACCCCTMKLRCMWLGVWVCNC